MTKLLTALIRATSNGPGSIRLFIIECLSFAGFCAAIIVLIFGFGHGFNY